MADFFRRQVEGDPGLQLFGGLHIGLSVFFAAVYVLIAVFRKKLRRFGHYKAVRRTMSTILFLNMVIHYTTRIAVGEWRLEEDLPFHLCFVTNFFMMYILFTDNKHKLYRVIYYFTLIGPLPVIIWPELLRTWSGYLFYQFIISHHIMLMCSVYCLFVLGYKTSVKSAGAALIAGNVYVGLIAVFNRFFGTDYVMMDTLPDQLYVIYPFLSAMPGICWLELIGIIILFVAYVPAAAVKKADKAQRREKSDA